jgi:type IV pilus assembly protein PilV
MPGSGFPPRGATLLEIAVTLLVLGIGLIGLASILSAALRADRASLHAGQAAQLAQGLAVRIRANPSTLAAGAYVDERPYAELTAPPAQDAPCERVGASCTPLALAASDLHAWSRATAELLPAGRGSIAARADGGRTVTVMWLEGAAGFEPARPDPACAAKNPPESWAGLRCLSVEVPL